MYLLVETIWLAVYRCILVELRFEVQGFSMERLRLGVQGIRVGVSVNAVALWVIKSCACCLSHTCVAVALRHDSSQWRHRECLLLMGLMNVDVDCTEIWAHPVTKGSNIYKSWRHRRKMFRVSEVPGCLCDTFSALILINRGTRHFLSQKNNVYFFDKQGI